MPSLRPEPDLAPVSPTDRRTRNDRRLDVLACVLLLLAPLAWLHPAVFGEAEFTPWDMARFPPWSLHHTAAEWQHLDSYPSDYDVTETPVVFGPEFELGAAEREAGRFPAWNPYARYGAPLFAPGLTAFLQPANAVLLWTSDPDAGLAWKAWISLAAAGLLTYMLLRELQLQPLAALLGALAFAYGGTITANLHFYNRVDALVWLPGMLFACARAARRRGTARIPAVLLLAATTALTWFSGFLPFSAPAMLVTGAWATFLLAGTWHRSGHRETLGLAVYLLVGVLLGLALTSVQLVPALSFYPESNRDLTPSAEALAANGYDPAALLGLFWPTAWIDCFGTPPATDHNPFLLAWTGRRHWDTGNPFFPPNLNYTEYALFVGLVALPFAVFALFAHTPARLRGATAFLVLAFGLLMLGSSWTAWAHRLPLLRNIQPMRFAGPMALPLAMLCAIGFDAVWREARDPRARRIATTVLGGVFVLAGLFAASLALFGTGIEESSLYQQLLDRYAAMLPPGTDAARLTAYLGEVPAPGGGTRSAFAAAEERLRGVAGFSVPFFLLGAAALVLPAFVRARNLRIVVAASTVLVLGIELYAHGRGVAATRVPLPRDETPTHEFLLAADRERFEHGGVLVLRAVAGTVAQEPTQLPPCTLFPYRIRDLNTYDWVDRWSSDVFRKLYAQEPTALIRNTWPRALPDDERLELPLFDALGVTHVLTTHPPGPTAGLAHVGPVVHTEEGPGGRLDVHARPAPLPRAFVVPSAETLENDDAVAARMIAADYDPRASVLFTSEVAEKRPELARTRGTGETVPRAVRFVRDDPDHIELELDDGPAGLLVLRDAALSGWRATIDGEPTEIARGNGFMRVVRAPAGPHRVEFRYDTPGLRLGLWVTRLAFLALIGLTVAWVRFRADETGGDEVAVDVA
jgi:hypothetical protein